MDTAVLWSKVKCKKLLQKRCIQWSLKENSLCNTKNKEPKSPPTKYGETRAAASKIYHVKIKQSCTKHQKYHAKITKNIKSHLQEMWVIIVRYYTYYCCYYYMFDHESCTGFCLVQLCANIVDDCILCRGKIHYRYQQNTPWLIASINQPLKILLIQYKIYHFMSSVYKSIYLSSWHNAPKSDGQHLCNETTSHTFMSPHGKNIAWLLLSLTGVASERFHLCNVACWKLEQNIIYDFLVFIF